MEHSYADFEAKGAKPRRNTNYCCVPQCSQYATVGVSSHTFPNSDKMRVEWETALRMGKRASSAMRVCGRHFLPSDYFPARPDAERKKLRPNAIPSQNLPVRQHDIPETQAGREQKKAREQRAKQRGTRETQTLPTEEPPEGTSNDIPEGEGLVCAPTLPLIMDVGVQANLLDNRTSRPEDSYSIADILCKICASCEKCTQVNFLALYPHQSVRSVTLPDLLNNNLNLFTFTGIHSVELLETLEECVKDIDIESATNKKSLSRRDRVLLTMVKIKENLSFTALGVLFGVCGGTCSNYFKDMCPKLSKVLSVVIPFPDQELIRCNLPNSFKKYKHTRIILDCAETPLEKCKCLRCRILTYSQYKKNYTAKFNLGCTPSGMITEVSQPFGGRASDKHIVNDSGILDKLDFRDGVMTDKGYRIEKECDERGLDLIRPPFLKKQQQMSREDALRNADIARARVHVERVIQRMRQYELFRGTIPWTLAPYCEDVLVIVAGLTNLGPPIINIDKFM